MKTSGRITRDDSRQATTDDKQVENNSYKDFGVIARLVDVKRCTVVHTSYFQQSQTKKMMWRRK